MLEPSEMIRRRAYERWEAEGRPSGRDLDHWLAAEAEVSAARQEALQESSPAASTDSAAKPRRRTNGGTARRPRTQ